MHVFLHDLQTNTELELVEKMSLIEWLATNYKRFGMFPHVNWVHDLLGSYMTLVVWPLNQPMLPIHANAVHSRLCCPLF